MQLKKNPKADLTKNSSLYFAIGLASVLFISWQAIEWKTYDKTGYGYEALNVEDDDDEEVPITEQLKTPPPHHHHHQRLRSLKLLRMKKKLRKRSLNQPKQTKKRL